MNGLEGQQHNYADLSYNCVEKTGWGSSGIVLSGGIYHIKVGICSNYETMKYEWTGGAATSA
jgi:hypothetical protein